MQHGPNSRRLIRQEAYKLFLTNNVEKVTIDELERVSKKIRGTIFYHFKNKQNIFESVVDEIFFPSFVIPINLLEIIGNVSLEQFIGLYKSPEKRVIDQIKYTYMIDQPEVSYYNFVSQAYKYCEVFNKRFNDIMYLDIKIWKTVIENAKKNRELTCPNTDELVALFTFFVTGLSFKKRYIPSLNLDYNEILIKLYEFIQRNNIASS